MDYTHSNLKYCIVCIYSTNNTVNCIKSDFSTSSIYSLSVYALSSCIHHHIIPFISDNTFHKNCYSRMIEPVDTYSRHETSGCIVVELFHQMIHTYHTTNNASDVMQPGCCIPQSAYCVHH